MNQQLQNGEIIMKSQQKVYITMMNLLTPITMSQSHLHTTHTSTITKKQVDTNHTKPLPIHGMTSTNTHQYLFTISRNQHIHMLQSMMSQLLHSPTTILMKPHPLILNISQATFSGVTTMKNQAQASITMTLDKTAINTKKSLLHICHTTIMTENQIATSIMSQHQLIGTHTTRHLSMTFITMMNQLAHTTKLKN